MIWIVKRYFKKKINSEEIWSYKTCLYSFFLELHNNIFQRSERNTTGDTFCCLILRSMHLIRGLSFMHWCTKWREKKKRDEFSNFNFDVDVCNDTDVGEISNFLFLIACAVASEATFFSNFDDAVFDMCWMSFCRAMLKNLCFVRFQREGTAACVIIIVAWWDRL